MKKILVNFYDKKFKNSHEKLKQSALKFGIDEVISFTDRDIKKTDFYKKNKAILDQKRGAGYWLWKPYIILETLKKLKDDDILFYADSGIEVIESLAPLIELLRKEEKGVLTFSCGGQINKTWTKRDCFILMDCDNERYWNSEQRLASFHLYRKTDTSLRFLNDWVKYGEDERIITDKDNTQKQENLSGFIDHRHDQSIFSLLAIKNNFEMFRDPTQWGNYLKSPEFRKPGEFLHRDYSPIPCKNSPYGTLLNHHRQKKLTILNRTRNKMKKILDYLKRKIILTRIRGYKDIDGWLTPIEATTLYTFARKVPPQGLVVEIGSWKGKSTYCLAKGAGPSVQVIAIDPFDYSGEPGSKEVYEKRKSDKGPLAEFTEKMEELGVLEKITIKKGFSRDFINQVDNIDLLFIDGDHGLEGCKFDYENYAPKIKSKGYLLFHDYDPSRKSFGPTWVIENLVIPSRHFKIVGTYGSLFVFRKF